MYILHFFFYSYLDCLYFRSQKVALESEMSVLDFQITALTLAQIFCNPQLIRELTKIGKFKKERKKYACAKEKNDFKIIHKIKLFKH